MGTFRYGLAGPTVELEDVILDRLRAVVVTKLRRSEGFMLTWFDSGGAPISVWLSHAVPMSFEFATPLTRAPDRKTVEQMMERAYLASGLVIRRDSIDQLDFQTVISDPLH